MRNLARECEAANEVPEFVREDERGEPHLVGGEAGAAPVVELDHILGISAHVGYDEADSWEEPSGMPLDLRYDPSRPVP